MAPQYLEANAVGGDDTNTLQTPSFGNYDSALIAIASRRAARLNAASIPLQEHQLLLQEREKLVQALLDGNISKKESCRLEYVRWTLDRIEDAKHGEAMDRLSGAVTKYEQFLHDVRRLERDLQVRKRSK